MTDPFDEQSGRVAALLREARGRLSEAETIFETETTAEHRQQWPNIYRLESATQHAQEVLALVNPLIISEAAGQEMVAAATQARDIIQEAVTTGGGSLHDAAENLLRATSQIEVGLGAPDLSGVGELRKEVDNTRDEIKTQISEAAAEVSGQKEQAFSDIKEATAAVQKRREAADQQARELGQVTSSLAAQNLAEAYAPVAKRTEKHALVYTGVSIAVGVAALAVTAVGLLTLGEQPEVEQVIAHAAWGIPVALLAAYVNTLAGAHRREAWRLRHIELQIRTANPFLGLLNIALREETLATMALRFFPGQESVSFDGNASADPTPELLELVRTILQQHGVTAAPVATPKPPATT